MEVAGTKRRGSETKKKQKRCRSDSVHVLVNKSANVKESIDSERHIVFREKKEKIKTRKQGTNAARVGTVDEELLHLSKEGTEIGTSSLPEKTGKTQQSQRKGNATIMDSNSTTASSKGAISHHGRKNVERTSSFKERLQSRLESGRFRWINEKLYTTDSNCALKLFESNPGLFEVYHQGFSSQIQKWPVNPVDEMIKWINERSSELIIADMGCGEAKISQSVPNKVFSFDLVATNDHVTLCDMAKVPLPDKSVHVVIYCLSLMGTNLHDFLKEARRILMNGGIMKVAEVVSRFDDIKSFEEGVCRLGFSLLGKDTNNKMFVQFDFKKSSIKRGSIGILPVSLKPCVYKKR